MDENQQDDQNLNNSGIEKLEKDLKDAMGGWKRTAADFDNYRRRKEAENKELVEFAREVTVAKLLPTLDSLEQALKHMPEVGVSDKIGESDRSDNRITDSEFASKYQNWQNGAAGIVSQLDKALEELGVRKIEALGKKFDPHFHEAVREVESEAEDGMVVEELQTGFELNGKVIRPSQVIISKKKQ